APFFTKYRKWMVLFLGITSFFILARMISNPFVNGNLPRHFHSFYFGIFIFELYRIKTLKPRLTFFDLTYFLQFIALIYISLNYINHRTIASIISAVLIGILVLNNSKKKINHPVFLFLGKISYSLYITHIPILE
ncbi:MAG: acyltransferase family protein, partial [Candidatus Neomarinimicrobiota bacterium]